MHSSQTLVPTRAEGHYISVDGIPHSYCRETSNLYRSLLVTANGGLTSCEMLRILHCVDNRLTDGGEAVSLKPQKRSTTQNHHSFFSSTHFSLSLSIPHWLVRPEVLGKLLKFIGSRTRDLPDHSIAPQRLRYRVHLDSVWIGNTRMALVRHCHEDDDENHENH
jgi:hypothetical protein